MGKLVKKINAFWKEEDGVTAIEYGLIAALIAVVIIVAVTLIGNNLLGTFNFIGGELTPPAAG